MKQLREEMVKRDFKPSLRISFIYLSRDLFVVAVMTAIGLCLPELRSYLIRFIVWDLYGFVQGLFFTGLWVIAHECGHGAFSTNGILNDALGWSLHSALLVPYFSWKLSHHQHHMFNAHMDKDTAHVPHRLEELPAHLATDHPAEDTPLVTLIRLLVYHIFGFQLYLIFNVTAEVKSGHYGKRTWWNASHFAPWSVIFMSGSWPRVLVSDLGIALTVLVLCMLSQRLGWLMILKIYFIPYLWVNCWIGKHIKARYISNNS